MAHKHPVYDTDKHFVIDPITKRISTECSKVVLPQHSHRSERFTFEIPKEVEGHDMSLCNLVEVHFQNIDASNQENNSYGIYKVEDLKAEGDTVYGSWLIEGDSTYYAGALIFALHFACLSDTGEVEYNLPTLSYSAITIGQTVFNSETIAMQYPNIIAEFEYRIAELERFDENLKPVTSEQIASAVEDYMAENPVEGGMTKTAKTLILSLFRNAAYTSAGMGNVLTQLEALWNGGEVEPDEPDVPVEPDTPDEPEEPEVTLTRISATYSGGDVTAGTDVSALTDIVVIAHYSDGTGATVTGYTLSGTIAEGSNTITVTYEGKTATFTVTGVAESSGGDGLTVVDAYTAYEWYDGMILYGQGVEDTSETRAGDTTSTYISIENVDRITVTEEIGGGLASYKVFYFDAQKTYVDAKGGYVRKDNASYPSPVELTIPDNAAFVRFTNKKTYVDGSSSSILMKYNLYVR